MIASKKRLFIWIPIVLVVATAIILRVYAIDRLPPGLFGDEAVEGLDALDVLTGNLGIWFHAHLGREPMYVYLVALSYGFFGVTPLATRLPALIAGLLTIPATFLFVREWASQILPRERATRLAILTTALVAISFWHVQMSRDAHRDTLLPLVEAVGYWLLWRALRTRDRKMYASAGAVLGLAIYTYSPGRFVGVFVAIFFAVEFAIWVIEIAATRTRSLPAQADAEPTLRSLGQAPVGFALALRRFQPSDFRGVILAASLALIVMLPLGIYFAQNPAQFSRRFASVSIFDFPEPAAAFASSVVGNLAQFVVPGAGYESKHYNLPGRPVFDWLIAPWFLAGVIIALARWKQSPHRFLLLWFIVMMVPAFLTADMIPKGVRVLGVVPGVFVFPALAMEWVWELAGNMSLRAQRSRVRVQGALGTPALQHPQCGARVAPAKNRRLAMTIVISLILLCIVGSAGWTTYDYFVAWANLPELPLAFDADLVQVSEFINRQAADQTVYISEEVYRPPTLMLLGEHVPTSRYVDRATRFKESDARTTLIFGADYSKAIYVFVRDYVPPDQWLARVAPKIAQIGEGEYYEAYRLAPLVSPQQMLDVSFNPLLKLVGVSQYNEDPRGVVLYWQIMQLPPDRTDIQATLSLADGSGGVVTQGKHLFGLPPLEWAVGDKIVEWYALDVSEVAAQFRVQLSRGADNWESPLLPLK